MSMIRQLKPEEYSGARKQALEEAKEYRAFRAELEGKSEPSIVPSSFSGKVKCSKCGGIKGCGKNRYLRLVSLFSGESEVAAKYLCKDCRKEMPK